MLLDPYVNFCFDKLLAANRSHAIVSVIEVAHHFQDQFLGKNVAPPILTFLFWLCENLDQADLSNNELNWCGLH